MISTTEFSLRLPLINYGYEIGFNNYQKFCCWLSDDADKVIEDNRGIEIVLKKQSARMKTGTSFLPSAL